MTDYFVRFVNDLNPNGETEVQWPLFTSASRETLTFKDGDAPIEVTSDVERLEATDLVSALTMRFAI